MRKPGSGSCLAYFRACSYPATRHYRPRRFFFHRKSAATWGLIPAKNPAAVANASVISASKAHTVVLLADRVSPCRHTLLANLAASVSAPRDAAWPCHRQGSDGPQAVSSAVLDVA